MKKRCAVYISVFACLILLIIAQPAQAQCSYPAQEILYQESVEGVVDAFVSCVTILDGSFQTTNVSAATKGYPAGNSELTGYGVVPSQVVVVFEGTNSHLLANTYTTNSGWSLAVDLNAVTGGEVPVSGSPLASFDDSHGQHVFYIGNDHSVRQMYYTGGKWTNQTLVAGDAAETGSSLVANWLTSGSTVEEYAVYEGSGGHVRLLFFNGSSWSNTDLTAATGGAAPHSGTPFAATIVGYVVPNQQLIYFLDTGENIQEYSRALPSGQWSDHAVTGLGELLPVSNTRLFTAPEALPGSEPTYHVFYMTSVGDATDVADAFRPDNAYSWTVHNLMTFNGTNPPSINLYSADGTIPLGGVYYTTPQLVYSPAPSYPSLALLFPYAGSPPVYNWETDTLTLPPSDNIVSPLVVFTW